MSTQAISNKPYFLRALHEWITDSNRTVYIAVQVDDRTRVPQQYVKDGQITLDISHGATAGLQMGNELIEFNARFSGASFKIEVPVDNVLAIYAKETGEGMAFQAVPVGQTEPQDRAAATAEPQGTPNKGFLKVVK